jgi:voltage-gated potassium channel
MALLRASPDQSSRHDLLEAGRAFWREIRGIMVLILSVIALVVAGTVGYHVIEGWHFFDSLYMTVITLGSVGYGETHPLSTSGRIFTIVLIIVGLGLFTALYSLIGQKLLQRQLFIAYRGRRMLNDIKKLSNHTIICGYGRLARTAAQQLKRDGQTLIIIEKEPHRIAEAREAGYLVLEGDGTVDETLINAGIKRARHLVSVLSKDSDNLYVVLTSRELSADLFILSRAEDETGEKRLERAGANRVISPYRIGGQKIAEGLLRPYVTDFLDLAVSSTQGHLQIEEIKIPQTSALQGLTLVQAELRQKTNVIVAAIISPEGTMLFNPDGDTPIEAGATFIALGLRTELVTLEELLLQESS